MFAEEVTLVDSLTSAPVTRGSDVTIQTIEGTKGAAADENLHLTLLFRETVRVRLDPVGSLSRGPGHDNAELAVELTVGGQATVGYAKRVIVERLDLRGKNAADHLVLTLHRGGNRGSAANNLDDGKMLDGIGLGPTCVLTVEILGPKKWRCFGACAGLQLNKPTNVQDRVRLARSSEYLRAASMHVGSTFSFASMTLRGFCNSGIWAKSGKD
jgi:hypothetical protein